MNIVIITQDSPFYLAENINYFLSRLPSHSRVSACVLLAPSPFGKKETTSRKILKTYRVFGLRFFLNYGLRFVLSRLVPARNIRHILARHNITTTELEKSINSKVAIEMIRHHQPDLLISIQANVIFKRPLIDLAPQGCLNVHTAMLPKYRGLMPTFWVMKNNEKVTGVSVFFIDEGIDSGPILVQKQVTIGDRTLDQLIRHTKRIGMDALIEAVELIHRGGYQLIENDDSQKTYYSFPTKEDVKEFRRVGKKFF
jgi:methionyl-tRNA formyltransferase